MGVQGGGGELRMPALQCVGLLLEGGRGGRHAAALREGGIDAALLRRCGELDEAGRRHGGGEIGGGEVGRGRAPESAAALAAELERQFLRTPPS